MISEKIKIVFLIGLWLINSSATNGERADLNARDDQEQTPLFEAVESNDNIEVISFLISNGADPTAINDCEESLLEYCENRDGSVKAVQKIIRNAVKNKSN